jgi:hypothetical protein
VAISFNTAARADSGAVTAANVQLTIPAGVLAGDVVLVVASAFAGASGATLSASSTGTAPVLVDQAQTALFAGLFHNGGLWQFTASGSDAGKVITVTLSGGTNPFWSAVLAAYTGVNGAAPVDVHGVNTAAGSGITQNTPSLTTGTANDWAVQAAAVATPNNALTEPAGTTSRQKNIAASFIAADICDSNASVGGAGTGIGGGTYSVGAGNVWYVTWTAGLTPAGVVTAIPAKSSPSVTAAVTSAPSVTDPRDGAATVRAAVTSSPSVT